MSNHDSPTPTAKTNVSSKQKQIVSMFDAIAPTYDLTNRVMSFGIDKHWRRIACNRAIELSGQRKLDILDVACGTGDMLLYWQKSVARRRVKEGTYTGVDPSREMLAIARKRLPFARFERGSAQSLAAADSSYDMISISYGIRNVMQRSEAFAEFYRVLRPGGLVVLVEFMKRPGSGLLSRLVNFYMRHVIPAVGGLLSRNRAAYQYLPDSIDGFLTKTKVEAELTHAGFVVAHSRTYSLGVSSLIIARKPGKR